MSKDRPKTLAGIPVPPLECPWQYWEEFMEKVSNIEFDTLSEEILCCDLIIEARQHKRALHQRLIDRIKHIDSVGIANSDVKE